MEDYERMMLFNKQYDQFEKDQNGHGCGCLITAIIIIVIAFVIALSF